MPNTKRNNFTKQNSKDLSSKFYRKIHNFNYNTYNTISSEKNEKIFNCTNSSTSIKRSKIKRRISIDKNRKNSYINNMNRNNRNNLNKSCITEDLIKIKKLKEIIRQRKVALGIIDINKKSKEKSPKDFNNKKILTIMNQSKRNTYTGENDLFKKNYILNRIKNTNLITKKNYINQISDDRIIKNSNKNIITKDNINKSKNLSNGIIIDNKYNTINKNDSKSFIKITRINIIDKNEYDLFFDILLWMYCKDIRKLKKFSKNFNILLHLLSLSNFLKMKQKFYKALLTHINKNFKFDLKFFNSQKWTRNKISFYALEKIIPLINGNYNRINALILWLKPLDGKNKNISYNIYNNKITKEIKEIIHSKDFYLVRNYIKKYKLIYSLNKEEIIKLKNKYNYFIDCLDIGGIIDNFILTTNDLVCALCNKKFNSVYQIQDNNENKERNNNNSVYININKNYKLSNGQYLTKNIDNDNIKINNNIDKSCNHLIMINNFQIND